MWCLFKKKRFARWCFNPNHKEAPVITVRVINETDKTITLKFGVFYTRTYLKADVFGKNLVDIDVLPNQQLLQDLRQK